MKTLHHPTRGVIAFEHTGFQTNDDPGLKLVIYTPVTKAGNRRLRQALTSTRTSAWTSGLGSPSAVAMSSLGTSRITGTMRA